MPVSPGKGRDWWAIKAYAQLVFFGNTRTKNRPHKTGKRKGVGQGDVSGVGLGNPFLKAAKSQGSQVAVIMKKRMLSAIQKEFTKQKRKRV